MKIRHKTLPAVQAGDLKPGAVFNCGVNTYLRTEIMEAHNRRINCVNLSNGIGGWVDTGTHVEVLDGEFVQA